MKSAVIKRSILVFGHRTSVSLEDRFWFGLRQIATARSIALSELIGQIDASRDNGNLSSALRLFVFDHFCEPSGVRAPADPRDARRAIVANPARAEG